VSSPGNWASLCVPRTTQQVGRDQRPPFLARAHRLDRAVMLMYLVPSFLVCEQPVQPGRGFRWCNHAGTVEMHKVMLGVSLSGQMSEKRKRKNCPRGKHLGSRRYEVHGRPPRRCSSFISLRHEHC
jgi:hypothetical protein